MKKLIFLLFCVVILCETTGFHFRRGHRPEYIFPTTQPSTTNRPLTTISRIIRTLCLTTRTSSPLSTTTVKATTPTKITRVIFITRTSPITTSSFSSSTSSAILTTTPNASTSTTTYSPSSSTSTQPLTSSSTGSTSSSNKTSTGSTITATTSSTPSSPTSTTSTFVPTTSTTSSPSILVSTTTSTTMRNVSCDPLILQQFTALLLQISPDLLDSQQQEFIYAVKLISTYISSFNSTDSVDFGLFILGILQNIFLDGSSVINPLIIQSIKDKLIQTNPLVFQSEIDSVIYTVDYIIQTSLKYLDPNQFITIMMGTGMIFYNNFLSQTSTTTLSTTSTASTVSSTLTVSTTNSIPNTHASSASTATSTSSTVAPPVTTTSTATTFLPLFTLSPEISQQLFTFFLTIAPNLTLSQITNLTNAFNDLIILSNTWTTEQINLLSPIFSQNFLASVVNGTLSFSYDVKNNITQFILTIAPNTTLAQIDSIFSAVTNIVHILGNNVISLISSTTASTTSSTTSTTTSTTTSSSIFSLTSAQKTQLTEVLVLTGLTQPLAQQLINSIENVMIIISSQPKIQISAFASALPLLLPQMISQILASGTLTLSSIQQDAIIAALASIFPDMTLIQQLDLLLALINIALVLQNYYLIAGPIAMAIASFMSSILGI